MKVKPKLTSSSECVKWLTKTVNYIYTHQNKLNSHSFTVSGINALQLLMQQQ